MFEIYCLIIFKSFNRSLIKATCQCGNEIRMKILNLIYLRVTNQTFQVLLALKKKHEFNKFTKLKL